VISIIFQALKDSHQWRSVEKQAQDVSIRQSYFVKGDPKHGLPEKVWTEPSAGCIGFASSACANCAKKMYALTSPCAKPVRVLKYKCSNTAAEMVFTVGHLQQECFSFPVQSLLVYICMQKDPLVHVRV